jgi:superfamily II DNA/RNA helicase
MNEPTTNFVFQAINGSGKTLSFGIPSIMKVDTKIDNIQIVILANTRELIRQIQQVIEKVSKNTGVKSCIGDQSSP